jgi:hypothetical protein
MHTKFSCKPETKSTLERQLDMERINETNAEEKGSWDNSVGLATRLRGLATCRSRFDYLQGQDIFLFSKFWDPPSLTSASALLGGWGKVNADEG